MLVTGDRHQARQRGPILLQAEALRLQQRADRGLQIPLDVRRQSATRPPPGWCRKGDSRVTRVGAFIRKTSIDELPQLINVVFKGNPVAGRPRARMRCTPRPPTSFYDDAVDGYFARHRVKPA